MVDPTPFVLQICLFLMRKTAHGNYCYSYFAREPYSTSITFHHFLLCLLKVQLQAQVLLFFTAGGCHFGTKLFGAGIDVKFKAHEHYGVCYKPNKATRSAAFCHHSIKLCNEKQYQLPSGYCTDHTDRPWLCDMCWERMTHSSATYTAVNYYDFMKFAHSTSQAALWSNIYHSRFTL